MAKRARAATVRRPRRSGATMIAASRAVAPALKASYHMGGGRVLRRFFDMNDADLDAIVDRIGRDLLLRAQATERVQ